MGGLSVAGLVDHAGFLIPGIMAVDKIPVPVVGWLGIWRNIRANNSNYVIDLEMKQSTYKLVRKVHLYASLPIVALLLMYVVSSYFMIHYESFHTYDREESIKVIQVGSDQVSGANWDDFIAENGVSGKLTNETTTPEGNLIREYSRAGKQYQLTLMANENQVELKIKQANFPGFIVGLHRIRGFNGPWQYQVYAVLLDLVGVSLILFAITGAILWLKLLKNDIVAWIIFIAGFVYVSAVMVYLMIT